MSSGGHVKLDLIEFIQVIDDVNTKMVLQEGASCVEPVTTRGEKRERLNQYIVQ